MAYTTPGVFVEEVSTLPPSVAEVSTAIPAFIGYTKTGPAASGTPKVERISNMLEFEATFGGDKSTAYSVQATQQGDTWSVTATRSLGNNEPDFVLYYALSLYFKNGGGSCYIISVGNFEDSVSETHFEKGLEALKVEDEPTLIVMPDAVVNLTATKYYTLCQSALAQSAGLGDRFTLIDVSNKGNKNVDDFRDAIGINHLAYGAAYYPYLDTALVYKYNESGVTLTIQEEAAEGEDPPAAVETNMKDMADSGQRTALYNQLKNVLSEKLVTLPPSSAIAGVYAAVDRSRGVWKAPANVSLASVIGPAVKINDETQGGLNVDPNAGKSINAIRAFSGKGTLVWGARTLAGNDNEWRYISVRRLFNLIEESTKKASAFAVFEPNDATTWLKVKAMIESYLFGLWEKGALQGSKPDQAYFVNVGLGKSMTAQDILEGRMIVEIGIAAVRPAEFIILRFSHKMPEA